MRNPIRLKNFRTRFLPLYLLGALVLWLYPPQAEAAVWALPLVCVGLALRSWGAGHLVKNDVLTTTGPYAHLRHPLYAGTILISTGFLLWIGGWVSVLALGAVWPWFALHYFPRKERTEAARLETLYGAAFVRYRAAVPALWPRRLRWSDDSPEDKGQAVIWSLGRYSENNELGTVLAVLVAALVFSLRAVGPA